MSSVRPGVNINEFKSSSSSPSEEQTEKIFYSIAYYFVSFLNWICEAYTQVVENPIIILWVFCGLFFCWIIKRIFKWLRERSLVKRSIKNMNN